MLRACQSWTAWIDMGLPSNNTRKKQRCRLIGQVRRTQGCACSQVQQRYSPPHASGSRIPATAAEGAPNTHAARALEVQKCRHSMLANRHTLYEHPAVQSGRRTTGCVTRCSAKAFLTITGGPTPRVWTQTGPPTNCWPQTPWGGGGGGRGRHLWRLTVGRRPLERGGGDSLRPTRRVSPPVLTMGKRIRLSGIRMPTNTASDMSHKLTSKTCARLNAVVPLGAPTTCGRGKWVVPSGCSKACITSPACRGPCMVICWMEDRMPRIATLWDMVYKINHTGSACLVVLTTLFTTQP